MIPDSLFFSFSKSHFRPPQSPCFALFKVSFLLPKSPLFFLFKSSPILSKSSPFLSHPLPPSQRKQRNDTKPSRRSWWCG